MKNLIIKIMHLKVIFVLLISLISSSCVLTGNVSTSDLPSRKEIRQQIDEEIVDANKQEIPVVRYFDGPYVDSTPVVFKKGAEVLSGYTSFESDGLQFHQLATQLLGNEDILSIYENDVSLSMLETAIDLKFTGELREALNKLSKIVGVNYKYSDDTVRWHRYITKSYAVAVPNGAITWAMSSGGTSIGGIGEGGGGGGEGGGGGGGGGGSLGDSGTVSVTSSLDLWGDIEKSITQLIGNEEGASFTSNPAIGTITITASSSYHDQISDYIEELNQELLIRVELELKILQVSLSEDDSFGIDWQAVLQDTQEGVTANYAGSQFDGTNPFIGNFLDNRSLNVNGSEYRTEDITFLIDALQRQGEVLISDAPRAVTLNNNPVIISDVQQNAYVARTVAGSSSGTGNAGVGIEPGVVSTGVQFLIVPKVIGQDIVLQIQTTISTRGEFKTFTSSIGTIETPEVNVSSNNLRVKVRNGSSVIIGGLKRVNHDGADTAPFAAQFLGSTTRKVARSETILIISARTLEG